MWAVLPYKGATNAKRRLSPVLDQNERATLVSIMIRDVIQALRSADSIDKIVLLSKSPLAEKLAFDYGLVLYEEKSNNLVDALVEVSNWLIVEHKAPSTFIVPGDIPLITPQAVDRAAANHHDVTIIPDRFSIGTNGLICTPPNAFPYVFDGKSFAPHCDAARKSGLHLNTDRILEFELDIDTPDDLAELINRAPESHTGQFLIRTDGYQELTESIK